MRSDEIDAIFEALDENGDGVVTMEELVHVLERSRLAGSAGAMAMGVTGDAMTPDAWILRMLDDMVLKVRD